VEEIAGVIPGSVIEGLYGAMKGRKGSIDYDAIAAVVEDLVADGWSATQVMTQLYEMVIYDELVSDKQKSQIVMIFSEVDKRLVDGVDEQLAILDLAVRVSNRLVTT